MCPRAILAILLLAVAAQAAAALRSPANLASREGDRSVVLHWNPVPDARVRGYHAYRSSTREGPFARQNPELLTSPGFCDLHAANGETNYYQVTAVSSTGRESAPSEMIAAAAKPFASSDQFLDYVQGTAFDYFWYLANPRNGLVPDRSSANSPCSIAAVGFGLTAIGVGIDHRWITRAQGARRVKTTLKTFLEGPQGTNAAGVMGCNGWFYHFLDMKTGVRASSELSSIDTSLLLCGVLYAKQYFNAANAEEGAIREMAEAIFDRVNWNWMARETEGVCMAWHPETGFISNNWMGYNEGMMIYILGLGSSSSPLPANAWSYWTSGYHWATNYGHAYIPFGPLFGYQYSHCWIDFRHTADAFMSKHGGTYFENSRHATLAQAAYAVANPHGEAGYSSNVWGFTASDGPTGYQAHGLPPDGLDDGTITPAAPGGAIAFTPEESIAALTYFYAHFRERIWTAFGFRDAFNLGKQWFDSDELGIDEGPIVIMIENYRTERPWQFFMKNPEVQRGLRRAGFVSPPAGETIIPARIEQSSAAQPAPAKGK